MDFSFLPSNPQPLNALLASYVPNRPRDPNGIDVYGELPYMQRAYALTRNGANAQGTEEAGYAIMRKLGGQFFRTPTQRDSQDHINLHVPPNAFAVVHTHPQKADPRPGPEDAHMNFPNYVFSGQHLYATVPHTDKFYQYDIDKWNAPGMGNSFLANTLR